MNFKNFSLRRVEFLSIFLYFKPLIYGQPKLPKIALPGTIILVDVFFKIRLWRAILTILWRLTLTIYTHI